jgi:hypothetical protein
MRAALGRGDGDLAVVDAEHGSRARPHEGHVVQAVTALQVHDLGRAVQDLPQEPSLRPDEGRAGRGLGQQVLVLADVLARRRLLGCPVRPRQGVHGVMLSPVWPPVNRPKAPPVRWQAPGDARLRLRLLLAAAGRNAFGHGRSCRRMSG